MNFLISLILASVIAAPSFGAPIKGYDILGLAMQDIDLLKSTIRGGSVLGVLEGTFGDPVPKLSELNSTMGLLGFRVHLRDGTCYRRHNCEGHYPPINDLAYMGRLARKYNTIADETGLKCYISPVLEYDEKSKSRVLAWVHLIRHLAPLCRPILSPASGYVPRGYLVERHLAGAGHLISSDGYSSFRKSLSFLNKTKATVKLLWWPTCNLLDSRGPKIPPSRRRNKITARDMYAANRALAQIK